MQIPQTALYKCYNEAWLQVTLSQLMVSASEFPGNGNTSTAVMDQSIAKITPEVVGSHLPYFQSRKEESSSKWSPLLFGHWRKRETLQIADIRAYFYWELLGSDFIIIMA